MSSTLARAAATMKSAMFILVALLLSPLTLPLRAEVRLPSIFAKGMVLQQSVPVPVWGWGTAGETVSLSLGNQTIKAVAGPDGRWKAQFSPLTPGGPYTLIASGSSSITVSNVSVGEVWLVTGSPNLLASFKNIKVNAPKNLNLVSFFSVPYVLSETPNQDVPGNWSQLAPSSIDQASAVATALGQCISATTKVPVGIIFAPSAVFNRHCNSYYDSDIVEAWVPFEEFSKLPFYDKVKNYFVNGRTDDLKKAFPEFLAGWKSQNKVAMATVPQSEKEYDVFYYERKAQAALGGEGMAEPPPQSPNRTNTQQIASVWNGMLAPIAPYALRGIVYAPGYGNLGNPSAVAPMLDSMIRAYRVKWNNPALSFLCLGTLPCCFVPDHPEDVLAWHELYDALRTVAQTPNAGVIPLWDLLGASGRIDSLNYGKLLDRIGNAALTVAYGQTDKPFCGPVIADADFRGDKVILKVFNPKELDPATKEVKGFALYSENNHWVWSAGFVENGTIIVSNPKVPAPTAIRYQWMADKEHPCTLRNRSGISAFTFRTDNQSYMCGLSPIPQMEWASHHAPEPNLSPINPSDIYPVDDPTLPRALTMGDSIHSGYRDEVKRCLVGRVNVVCITTPINIKGALEGKRPLWCLKPGDFDVLHINHGLHGDYLVPGTEYEQQLSAYFDQLKEVMGQGKIIWATTTPIPSKKEGESLDPELNPKIIQINATAAKLAAEKGIAIDDLYALVAERMDELSESKGNVHFKEAGRSIQAQAIVTAILKEIEKQSTPTKAPRKITP